MTTPREEFLTAYDREHAITLRVLRAYPTDQLELRPHPKAKTARELAWVFVLERGLGQKVWNDEFAKAPPAQGATPPKPPESWDDLLAALEKSHQDFRAVIAGASGEELDEKVHFFTAPKTMGEISRLEWIRFLLNDQIHHRGQFSVYLRMAGGKVPSIYGPSGDEPWV
jgi:uncharacterized damage-inducible protein DinB